jgi:hypothetical protein
MERDIILETIHRHLRQTRDASPPVTLSDLVGRIARELRQEKPDAGTVVSIIPIEQVAAFVDGDLDHDRVEAVNRSVLVDNSVLAELVAAVRVMQTPMESLPAVAETLTERLLATHPVEAVSNRDIARMIADPVSESRRMRWRVGVPVLVACAALAWFAITRPDLDEPVRDNDADVAMQSTLMASGDVKDASNVDGGNVDGGDVIGDDAMDPADKEPMVAPETNASNAIADATNAVAVARADLGDSAVGASTPSTQPSAEPMPVSLAESLAESAPDSMSKSAAETAETSVNETETKVIQEVTTAMPTSEPDRSTSANGVVPPQWKSLNIDRINGVLAAMLPRDETDRANDMPKYRRVSQGETVSLDKATRLRSLAMGDAAIRIDAGGTMLIPANTLVAVAGGGERTSLLLDVVEGAVAIEGVAKDSVIGLRHGATPLGMLVMGDPSRAVLYAVAGGVELRLQNVELFVDDQRIAGDGLRLTASGASKVPSPPSPSPNWLSTPTTPVDKVPSISSNDDVDLAESLGVQIKRLAGSSRMNDSQAAELSKLVQMRVSLAGERLFDLAAEQLEIVRRTAVESIALLPRNDPRYQPVWESIEDQINNPNQRGQIDVWMQLIRTGGQPTDDQLAAMVQGLGSNSPNVRGLSDVMLRRYVADPPPLNPKAPEEKMKLTILKYQQLLDQQ